MQSSSFLKGFLKAFLIIFKVLSVAKNDFRPENVSLRYKKTWIS